MLTGELAASMKGKYVEHLNHFLEVSYQFSEEQRTLE